MNKTTQRRCAWLNPNNPLYVDYHDTQWGVPVRDDRALFEMLILEGAQAGLSWETILKKREHYRRVFFGFDPDACAAITPEYEEEALRDAGIVRNRLKVAAVRINALCFARIREDRGSFGDYLWSFVDGKPLQPDYEAPSDMPVTSELSDRISRDLKARGMKFVGSTIVQAYMQAIGMINAHTTDCFRHAELRR